jgi:hypothetical protein
MFEKYVTQALLVICFVVTFWLTFDSEDGGTAFFRNIGEFLPEYTAVTSRKTVLFIAWSVVVTALLDYKRCL